MWCLITDELVGTDLICFLVRLGMSTLRTTFAEVSWLKELSWVEFSLKYVAFYLWLSRPMYIFFLTQTFFIFILCKARFAVRKEGRY